VDIQGTSCTADLSISRHAERKRAETRRLGLTENRQTMPLFGMSRSKRGDSAADARNIAAQGDERHHGARGLGARLTVMPGATTRPRFQASAITFLNLYIGKPVAVGQAKVSRRMLV
jgi:hypothetical protein